MTTKINQFVHARIYDNEITATLRYRHNDPFAARVIFPPAFTLDGAEAVWTFARSLLAEGLLSPAGYGDVHVRPNGPDRTMIEFRAPEGTALIEMASADIRAFLGRTYEAVPAGQESRHLDLDFDAELMTLLAGGR
jgi:hypothetical protein